MRLYVLELARGIAWNIINHDYAGPDRLADRGVNGSFEGMADILGDPAAQDDAELKIINGML